MNIFHAYAKKSLKKNRTRTIVTVIGIVLSVAMVTAVTTIITSIQQYGIRYAVETEGDWHIRVSGATAERCEELAADTRVSRTYRLENIGYATLAMDKEWQKPYLCIQGMDEAFVSGMPIFVTEGRLPERADELLLPTHLAAEAVTGTSITVGSRVTLSLGLRRDESGKTLWQDSAFSEDGGGEVSEEFVAVQKKTYTVSGFYKAPSFELAFAPGYTALTRSETLNVAASNGTESSELFLVLKSPQQAKGFYEELPDSFRANRMLLRFYGVSWNSSFNTILYGMGSILILIIIVGSVALIHNAFAISVSERMKEFGLLASVGASKRQMKKMVCYEAFLLCVIGVPLGIVCGIAGIGVTLALVGSPLAEFIGTYPGWDGRMNVTVSLPALAIAVAIGVLTVLVSAYLPMRRALGVETIDAVRQRTDIVLTKKQLRTPGWIGRCFGLEGMVAYKNMRRNRKQYRATVFSLAMSIFLFVTAGSFSEYLFGSAWREMRVSKYDISASVYAEDVAELLADREKLSAAAETEKVFEFLSVSLYCDAGQDAVCEEAKNKYRESGREVFSAAVNFVSEDVYAEILSRFGLDSEMYKDRGTAPAIVLNRVVTWDDNVRSASFPVLKEQTAELLCGDYDVDETAEQTAVAIGDVVDFETGRFFELSDQICGSMGGDEDIMLIYPTAAVKAFAGQHQTYSPYGMHLFFAAEDHTAAYAAFEKAVEGTEGMFLYDAAKEEEQQRALLLMINVFCIGFITLISLISAANVFNTISTNMNLRRREFAMLKSIGMSARGFRRMMNYECILYGAKGLAAGAALTTPVVVLLYYFGFGRTLDGFYLPWQYPVIASFCVFAVVYVTMRYGQSRVGRTDIAETLKGEIL